MYFDVVYFYVPFRLQLVPRLIRLLSTGQEVLAQRWPKSPDTGVTSSGDGLDADNASATAAATPKWMAPLLLLLDLYEKMAVGTRRRAAMEKVTFSFLSALLG